MKKKILIIIDMQNDFITGSLANKDAEAIVEPICKYISKFKSDIYYTQDTHDYCYLKTHEGKYLPIEHCIVGTTGWCLHDNISRALHGSGHGVRKYTFGYDGWEHFLDIHNTKEYEIEICGTCTDICVISNALILKALYSNVKITVLKDLCAGTTKEHHEQALEIMRQCQIEVK